MAIGGSSSSSSSLPSRVPEQFYIGDEAGAQRKRKLVQIAAGLARTIAEKMAMHSVPFSGTGHRLDEPRQKMKGAGHHRSKQLSVRMDRTGVAKAGQPLVA